MEKVLEDDRGMSAVKDYELVDADDDLDEDEDEFDDEFEDDEEYEEDEDDE